MTDDRTLLERAAKAAGMPDVGVFTEAGYELPSDDHSENVWNPLTDDGDAFRLSVKLSMRVEVWPEPINDMRGVVLFRDSEVAIQSEPDPCAATRRAVVRAAASMEAKE